MKKKYLLLSLVAVLLVSFLWVYYHTNAKITFQESHQEVVIGELARYSKTITYRGQDVERWFYYYVPSNYKKGDQLPLMITLHGSGANASLQLAEGNWVETAERESFIVVAPEAVGIHKDGTLSSEGKSLVQIGRRISDIQYLRWNASQSTDPQAMYGVNDVEYMSELIELFSETGMIDNSHTYVTGFSHGGFLALRMAIEAPEKIAGVGAVSALVNTEYILENPSEAVKIVFIHGSEDSIVPINGMHYDLDGDGEQEYTWASSLDDSVQWFADKYGMDDSPIQTIYPDYDPNDGTTIIRQALHKDGQEQIIKYVVEGGGHTWPGGVYSSGRVSQDAQASELLWLELKNAKRNH